MDHKKEEKEKLVTVIPKHNYAADLTVEQYSSRGRLYNRDGSQNSGPREGAVNDNHETSSAG